MSLAINLHNLLTDILERVKMNGIDAADVSAHQQTGFEVNARMGEVETIEHHQEKSITLDVYQNKRKACVTSSDLSPSAIDTLITKACTMVKFTEADDCAGIADKSLLAFNYPDLSLNHPWSVTPALAIKMAIACETKARGFDPRIKLSDGASVSSFETEVCYANTNDFVGHFRFTSHNIDCSVLAEENGMMERDYDYSSSCHPDKLASIDHIAEMAAQNTLQRLGAKPIKTQKCPVIFHPRVAKGLWSHLLSAISGGAMYRKNTFLLDHLGKQVLPDFVNIYQDPHLQQMLGSAPFDSEGVKTEKRFYIEDGVIKSYILGSYSARKLGMQSTGNADGVHNLFVKPGKDHFSDLLKKMGNGLLVTELMGQGVNILNGNYSRGAFGYWVKNGEIQFPVNEITIAGNLKDMFSQIIAIGNDVDLRPNIKTASVLIERMSIAGT